MSVTILKGKLDQSASSAEYSLHSKTFVELDPKLCKPWAYHDRDLVGLDRKHCADLIRSIQKNGQIEPIVVRRLQQDLGDGFEIIAGVRRWFACSQIPGQRVLARVIEVDDRTCMILMHAENADAQSLTVLERAYAATCQMKSGLFKNQTDFGSALGLSQSSISKLLRVASLFDYPWFSVLFESKRLLSSVNAYRLSALLQKTTLKPKIEAEAAALLAQKNRDELKLSASDIVKRLINSAEVKVPTASSVSVKPKVLFAQNQKALITVSHDQGLSLHINAQVKALDREQIARLCLKAIEEYLCC